MLKTKAHAHKTVNNKNIQKKQRKFPAVKKQQLNAMSTFSEKDVNPLVLKAEYAVRGELVIKADMYRMELQNPDNNLPFNKIIACNIGNPHELGQKPITFFRQVIALCNYPELLQNPALAATFPPDAISRAKKYLSHLSTTGAYTHSKGLKVVRDEIAESIQRRDGFTVDPDSIWVTDGASSAVKMVLQTIITGPDDGVLTPIPQYPLYSATLQLLNAKLVGYYLDEQSGWSLSVDQLEKQFQEATAKGTKVKSICVINPGNPTGQCLTKESISAVVKWAESRNIMILADEVYQDNVYSTTPFTSFHKVARELNATVPVFSFHSSSKGFMGECGIRGGYVQVHNAPQIFLDQLYKMSSVSLCSNVNGQLMMGMVASPPQEGDSSYQHFVEERDGILSSLKRRAVKMSGALNAMEDVSCQPIEGALYAFPQIKLSNNAIAAAKAAGKAPDTFYALNLLDNTGICVVSGSGFRQEPGTYHFRTTILPSEKDIDTVIEKMQIFHKEFSDKYRD